MENNKFNEIAKALSMALIDDFRGFLVEGKQRIEVPEDMLHLQIAHQEMLKVPNWKYESGTGQNPTIEYMKEKQAIYITKIPNENRKGEYQRTVGYLTDVYSQEVEYKGKKQLAYEVLKTIAIGMGYDVDEYTLQERTENTVKTPVSIVTYKGETHIKKVCSQQVVPHRSLSEGDQPVFGENDLIIGFISKGKFVSAKNYKRYAGVCHKSKTIEDEKIK